MKTMSFCDLDAESYLYAWLNLTKAIMGYKYLFITAVFEILSADSNQLFLFNL